VFLVLFLAFYSLFVISLAYTPSHVFAYKKTLYFSLCLLAFTYPIFIREFHIHLFYKVVLWIILPISIWFIAVKYLYWSGPSGLIDPAFEPLLGSYLGLSTGVVFLIFYNAHRNELAKVVMLSILLVALGSRGALLFSILILVFWRLDQLKSIKMSTSPLTAIAGIGLVPFIYFFWDTILKGFKYGLMRFSSILSFETDRSSNERLEYFSFAISKIFDSFSAMMFGYGIGRFGILFTGDEARDIPHNIPATD
jgi:hypothetical protein